MQDQSPKPKHVWNRIPGEVRGKVVKLALKETKLSPRELAVTFPDKESYFVSEASTYRILKAHDLITSPAFIVIKAASSKTKPQRSISFGKRTLPTSKYWAGAGSISARSSTPTAATSSPGSFARICGLKTLPIRLTLHCGHPAATKFTSFTSHVYPATTDPVTSQGIWRNGCRTKA